MNQIFIYDDLLIEEVYTKLKIKPIEQRIAETSGKIYMISNIPIMLLPDDITRTRDNRRVVGAIYKFDKKDMFNVLDTIDSYKCCSMTRIDIKHPLDLTYRTVLQVYPIMFDNIHELTSYRYKYLEPENCWVYLGNTKNQRILNCIKKDRHKKLTEGCYKQGLQNILYRLKYI
jgi:gamma-glutamylcyclotransferase (GGCT)/AIG2-like uncharacterized protein YtfP